MTRIVLFMFISFSMFSFHFIPSSGFSLISGSAHGTSGGGRGVAIHVIKIIMLRQQTNHKVLVSSIVAATKEEIGRDFSPQDRQYVVSIARKETNGHRCHQTVSLSAFVRYFRKIRCIFVSQVASENGVRLVIGFVSYDCYVYDRYIP